MTQHDDQHAVADRLELRSLADTYAAGVDRRDAELFVQAFHDGAVLAARRATPTRSPATGGRESWRRSRRSSRYERTYHFVGNARYELDGDRATGEVYGMAHHLTPDCHGGTDFVMLIRYLDTYERRRDAGPSRSATC